MLNNLTPKGRLALLVLVILVVCGGIYLFAPGVKVAVSKAMGSMQIDDTKIDNKFTTEKLDLPGSSASKKVKSQPEVRIMEYTWNGNSAMIVAAGGPKTTEGSLMEEYNVNLNILRKDDFNELQNAMVLAASELNDGASQPKSDLAAVGVSIMGDGAPYFISTLNQILEDKFGDKYHAVVVGAYGSSYGEDKLIGPQEWITNPKSMIGKIIITAVGDGDWVSSLNYIFSNQGIPVNPNLGTYDPNAVNFMHNPNIIECANEFNASQLNGKTFPFKEVVNGKLTGKNVDKKLDGCATWTPGDKIVFDKQPNMVTVSSTKDFPNQMATTLIVLQEWAQNNSTTVINLLKATYIAADQFKQYDDWREKTAQCVAKAYNFQSPQYWREMFEGKKQQNSNQIAGGTRVFNYADAMQYYGLGEDGIDRYKSVYEQVSKYLVDLNPGGFVESVGKPTEYSKAVDLSYLKAIKDIQSTAVEEVDYTRTATTVIASGEWHVNFAIGSDDIQVSSYKDLESLFNLLNQSDAKINVEGHTDNTGNEDLNRSLSERRANSVVTWLTNKGIKYSRFQEVVGKGSSQPVSDNNSEKGRSKNRRVQVVFLK